MKWLAVFVCLALLGRPSFAHPATEEERADVVSKLQDLLAELEGDHESEKKKLDGAELLEEVDISDMNLDDFKESGDEFILDTDKTADLLEEFRQAMANQPEVGDDDDKSEVILLKSQSMAQPESDEEASDNEHSEQDSGRKLEGAELLEEVDISDMNLDDFSESGDEFILDSDNTADLLEEFRQAMANQGEVTDDDDKDEVLLLHSKPNIERTEDEDDDADHHHHHHDEMNVAVEDEQDAGGHEHDQHHVGEKEKGEKLEGAELLEEVDISDMNLDDFSESGDEFILDSDNTADLLEEFRQAMANQGEVTDDDDKDEVIPLKSQPNIQPPPQGEEQEEHLDDEEVNELDLDTMEPAQSRLSDFEDNKADAEDAYPESPDSFVSEVLSNLNGEE